MTPTRSLGHPDASFVITQIKLAAYFDLNKLGLTEPGRTVLATRLMGGTAEGAGEFSLPPDQRFYAGGSGTIRGYRYQAVGPQFPGSSPSIPIGGSSIVAGSIEWRQRFGANFGGALFIDGGQVRAGGGAANAAAMTAPAGTTAAAASAALENEFRIGVGFGVRYYTGIGPIRLDLAVPTKRYSSDDDSFEIYIGLGQAF